MRKTFEKKDKDLLEITQSLEPVVTTESRAHILKKITHWEQHLIDIQAKIDEANAKLAILDAPD